ncbi:histone-lysine N-methyltransferase SETMAR [Trichonephila clavipes]|nr:histone-lysine N-methyltransferase SETMAR [Trichonephila clavipes]
MNELNDVFMADKGFLIEEDSNVDHACRRRRLKWVPSNRDIAGYPAPGDYIRGLVLYPRELGVELTTLIRIFGAKDAPRTGRPVVENVYKITEIIEFDQHVSSRSISHELKMDHKAILNHLHKVGFKKKLDVWVPHILTPKNMMNQIFICEALVKQKEIDPFLKRMMTRNEKWVTYDNIVRKRSWLKRGKAAQTVAKTGLTARKVLLCIWWDWKGVIYYELLPYGQTLNSDISCQQLDRLKVAIDQKRPELANRRGVVFHQDNARSRTSVLSRQKLWELGWEF